MGLPTGTPLCNPAFKGVRVRVRNGLVDVRGVPAASLGVFGTVLREAKWTPHGDAGRAAPRGAKGPRASSR